MKQELNHWQLLQVATFKKAASMRSLPLLLVVVFLCGCKERVRDQAAADGHEGVEAMIQVAPQTENIGRGVQDNLLASRGKADIKELPRPQLGAQDIVANPALYRYQAEKNKRDAQSSLFTAALVVGILTTLVAALKASGVGGPMVHWLGQLLENRRQQLERQGQNAAAELGCRVVRTIETLPPEQSKPIKTAISHDPAHTADHERVIRSVLSGGTKP